MIFGVFGLEESRRTYGFTLVRPLVVFQKIRASDFSDSCMKPRLDECKKVTFSFFVENSKVPFWAKNGPKLSIFDKIAQNQCFFKLKRQIFLMNPWLYKCKKWLFRQVVENSKLALVGPKIVIFFQFLDKIAPSQCFSLIFSK